MTELVYTPGQLKGWDEFASFYLDPNETVFKLKGYAGTGKSTLVQMFLTRLPQLDRMRKLVDPSFNGMQVLMTATTNQAALSLKSATGTHLDTGTIHSALGLTLVQESLSTKKLVPRKKSEIISDSLIFIDECSYIDQELLGWIFRRTKNCKFVFIGDPNQLTPIESSFMPVFQLGGPEATLTDLVRFDDGPLVQLVTNLRDTVETGNWHKFKLTPGVIDHVNRDDFLNMAQAEFQANNGSAKMLAFHNATVQQYNWEMSNRLLGDHEIKKGQRVVSNTAAGNGLSRVFTNEEVVIEDIVKVGMERGYNCEGYEIVLANKKGFWFMPKSLEARKQAKAYAKAQNNWTGVREIEDEWLDLRHAFSCTVTKSQGSTYGTAFVDLSDISKGARTANQLARLLYVANGRASTRLVLTGDIV